MKIIVLILMLLNLGYTQGNVQDAKVYANTMCVINVDYEADVVTVADFNGYEFEFTGCEDYTEGCLVSAIMSDMGTDYITDDVILSTRCSGWVDSWGVDSEYNILYRF